MKRIPTREEFAAFARAAPRAWLYFLAMRRWESYLLTEARGNRATLVEEDATGEPLVTIRIATYSAGSTISRALNSALKQTYERLQILVVGDCCDLYTAEVVKRYAARDDRIDFINLPKRGVYPRVKKHFWMVAGYHPMNVALGLAKGSWIAPCDDDDELTADHVESLLNAALESRDELVHSDAMVETPSGDWKRLVSRDFRRGTVSHGAILYHAELRFFRYYSHSWALNQPADWNLLSRMRHAGVHFGYLPQITYRHFKEGRSMETGGDSVANDNRHG